jgi:stress-induced morphogen
VALRQDRMHAKLEEVFQPSHLTLQNESQMHNVPRGSETHFKVLMVSEKFHAMNRLARQRLVYEALQSEISSGLHALTVRLYTPEEWNELDESVQFRSPECASAGTDPILDDPLADPLLDGPLAVNPEELKDLDLDVSNVVHAVLESEDDEA